MIVKIREYLCPSVPLVSHSGVSGTVGLNAKLAVRLKEKCARSRHYVSGFLQSGSSKDAMQMGWPVAEVISCAFLTVL